VRYLLVSCHFCAAKVLCCQIISSSGLETRGAFSKGLFTFLQLKMKLLPGVFNCKRSKFITGKELESPPAPSKCFFSGL